MVTVKTPSIASWKCVVAVFDCLDYDYLRLMMTFNRILIFRLIFTDRDKVHLIVDDNCRLAVAATILVSLIGFVYCFCLDLLRGLWLDFSWIIWGTWREKLAWNTGIYCRCLPFVANFDITGPAQLKKKETIYSLFIWNAVTKHVQVERKRGNNSTRVNYLNSTIVIRRTKANETQCPTSAHGTIVSGR